MNTINRSELKAKYGKEYVFVVDREDIPNFPHGYSSQNNKILDLLSGEGMFAPRYLVEYEPIVRQPIPYILVRQGEKYFAMTRLEGSGEQRLHGLISLGVGGHVNPVDNADDQLFFKAMVRELFEELHFSLEEDEDLKLEANFIGLINDDSNDVSRDHIGLVFVVDVPDGVKVTVRETDKYEGSFLAKDDLDKIEKDRLESWSTIVLDAIISKQ